jgi:uncharacterized membrane protein
VTWVQARHPRFGGLLDEAFDQIRHSGRDNVAVLERLRWSLAALHARVGAPARRAALRLQAERLQETVQRELQDPRDRERLHGSINALLRELDATSG